jgi:antitoxin component YwqK of YwqJK toxin-antitoxin module
MKFRFAFFIVLLVVTVSCRRQNSVVESAWPDGSPRRVCVYIGKGDNKELLKETFFYKNRKIQEDGHYMHGKRDGKWIYYYESGKVWSEGYFKDGKNDGRRVTYFPSGKIRYEAQYREDKWVGIWKFYDETGKLVKAVDYSRSAVKK